MIEPSKQTLKIFLAAFLILSLAWEHIEATRLGYQVEKARREQQILKGKISSLHMEMATIVSPAQLAAQAKTRLGMFPAAPESLRILDSTESAPVRETLLGRLFSRSRRNSLHT